MPYDQTHILKEDLAWSRKEADEWYRLYKLTRKMQVINLLAFFLIGLGVGVMIGLFIGVQG